MLTHLLKILTMRSIFSLIVWLLNLYCDTTISLHLDDNNGSDSSKDDSNKSSKEDSKKSSKDDSDKKVEVKDPIAKDEAPVGSEVNYTCRPLPAGESRTYTPLPPQPISNPGWFMVRDSEGVERMEQFVRVSSHTNPVPLDFMSESVAQAPSKRLPINPQAGLSAEEASLLAAKEEEAKIAAEASSNVAGPSSVQGAPSAGTSELNVKDEDVVSPDLEPDKSEDVFKKGKGKEKDT